MLAPVPPDLIAATAARHGDDVGVFVFVAALVLVAVFVFVAALVLVAVFGWRWVREQEDAPPGRGRLETPKGTAKMNNTDKTAEPGDLDELERKRGGKIIKAEIAGDTATVEMQPTATVDWYVNVWNSQAVIVAGDDALERTDYDGELYDRLCWHVMESLGGGINLGGQYYPQDDKARAMFERLLASKRARGETFPLGELAKRGTGGNVTAMARLLNGAGARLNEIEPDPTARVDRATVIALFAQRADDSVGHRLRELLSETMGE